MRELFHHTFSILVGSGIHHWIAFHLLYERQERLYYLQMQ